MCTLCVSLSEGDRHTPPNTEMSFRISNIKIPKEVMTELEQAFTFLDDRRLACVSSTHIHVHLCVHLQYIHMCLESV